MNTIETEQMPEDLPADGAGAVVEASPPTRAVGRLPDRAVPLSVLVQRASGELLPYLTHQIHYVGRAGIVGIALIVFSGVYFVSANSPLREQIVDLQSEYSSARQSHAKLRAGFESSPKDRQVALYSKLRPRADLPGVTETIVAQAAAAGLVLERGTYTVDAVKSGQLVRARLTFPVHGSYPRVRQFIDGTLAALAGVTVDGLRLERKQIGAAEIDADIRFLVYLRNTP